uniref:Uncharacterized protein n=1 Tax=Plectus sambesii TaxID=2011161 RepID=A0A914WZZ7_9BILA
MTSIAIILQPLPGNEILCLEVQLIDEEDEVGEQVLNYVKTFLELSNTAKKPIKLIFDHAYRTLRYPDVDKMASLIAEQEWFKDEVEDKDLFKIERVGRTCVVSGSNAKVIISVVKDEFMY